MYEWHILQKERKVMVEQVGRKLWDVRVEGREWYEKNAKHNLLLPPPPHSPPSPLLTAFSSSKIEIGRLGGWRGRWRWMEVRGKGILSF